MNQMYQGKIICLVMVTLMITACGKPFGVKQGQTESATMKVGWETPIEVWGPEAKVFEAPLGDASFSIAGLTLQEIVQSPDVAIRADDKSCVSCHGGFGSDRPEWDAGALSRQDFCDLGQSFLDAKKPDQVKEVIRAWMASGCPM